eukprot:TRINITY_DN11388_c0_g1_i1.p1 TRINITY_DN11388_c0_g1~~TRINITY_DN11388_c0_g1_i1.p1  ORF type:complete len:235 (-),score=60.00 TRINITY_DN11388_c0_g1_i1:114-818(-)
MSTMRLRVCLWMKVDKLVPVAMMSEPRKEHALVRIKTLIYALGGYNAKSKTFLKSCEYFSMKDGKWTMIASLITQRCAFAATSLNGNKIAVCGGYDGKRRLDSIEIYEPTSNSWKALGMKLPLPLSNLAAFNPYRDRIVILGGGFSSGFYTSVQMLNVKTGEYSEFAGVSYGKDLRNKVMYVNNAAYAFGGNNYSGEKLLLDNNKWVNVRSYDVEDNLDSWSCALSFRVMNTLQ